MAIIWENTFDGDNNVNVTPANSANYGDPVSSVTGVVAYDNSWAAHGEASARIGAVTGATAGEIHIDTEPGTDWSARWYCNVPSGGWILASAEVGADVSLWMLDDDEDDIELLGQDVSEHTGSLIGQPIRIEIAKVDDTVTARVWWTDPDSSGAHDLQVTASAGAWAPLTRIMLPGGGFSTPAGFVDEIAVGEGEWIGPAGAGPEETGAAEGWLVLYGEADGYPSWAGSALGELVLFGEADGRAQGLAPAEGWLVLYGEADGWPGHIGSALGELVLFGEADGVVSTGAGADGDMVIYGEASGFAGASVATGTPIRDMWLGPLGLLHRMRRRGEWERTPELGVEQHVSLHGVVTASRARSAARSTSLSWEHLDRADADALEEMTLVPARADATIAVVDPDAAAGNLLTPEQSRGRPGPGTPPVAVEHLYQVTGPGEVTVGMVSGVRYAVVDGAQSGTDVRWLHPYWGVRGWPVMPGWPVYMAVALADQALAEISRVWLTFYDHAGTIITSAAGLQGDGQCQADAPEGAATVSPHLIVAESGPGLRLLGEARLSFAPQAEDARPLGNGCPVYSVVSYSDSPYLPWRSTTLELQEVRALAYR